MSSEFKLTDYVDYDYLFNRSLERTLLEKINVYKNFQNVFNYGQNLIIPCVGANYNNYRILIIGESKYYTPVDSNDTDYFLWALSQFLEIDFIQYNLGKAKKTLDEYKASIFSKEPFISYKKYLQGKRVASEYKAWPFVNVINEMNSLDIDKNQALQSIAYTNFYSVPSVAIGNYNGFNQTRFNSLISSQIKTRKERKELWNHYNEKCVEVIDQIIDVLQPKLILFVSKNAGDQYRYYRGIHRDEKERIFYLYHSSGNNTWCCVNKNYDNQLSSKEICKQAITNLLQNI